jgi:predicted permease
MSIQDGVVGIFGMALPILVLILGGFTTFRFAMLAKKNSPD